VVKAKVNKPAPRPEHETVLSVEQENAVMLCCDLSTLIASVTGGAGTGKTLVLGKVYETLARRGRKVVLAAPTGRAAKRIQELTGIPAKTIHRLLEFPRPDEDDFGVVDPTEPKRNRFNRLDEMVVIVDEASMVAPTLYRQLIDALPNGGVIRFFGDNNQLPPVEDGEPPFIKILKERPMIELHHNFRSEDHIVSNAMRILRGSIPIRNDRFEVLYSDWPMKTLAEFATGEFAKDNRQIIMPTRRGNYGTSKTNPTLQLKFNKYKGGLRVDRYDEKEAKLIVKPKDKFIWIKNDYNLDLFNGEIGTVDWVDEDEGSCGLLLGDRHVIVPPRVKMFSYYHGTHIQYDPRKQLELGYAITTHKAQGSEFETVIYCISRGQAFLLNRRNFYTAITRAKGHVIIIADRRAMYLALRRAEV
jgi:exodeoxyribonuclease V alpha subunit